MSNSPLGQYAPLAATIASLGIIGAYVVALILNGMGILNDSNSLDGLQNLALLAAGAVFGSAVAVNGWKQPLLAAHDRIDRLEAAVNVEAIAANSPNVPITTHPTGDA